jgi:hypothetical protein
MTGPKLGPVGITLPSGVPSPTTNMLYNSGGSLMFNGAAIGGGGVGNTVVAHLFHVSGIAYAYYGNGTLISSSASDDTVFAAALAACDTLVFHDMFSLASGYTISKTYCRLTGIGWNSGITSSAAIGLVTDTTLAHRLMIDNIKIENTAAGGIALKIYKTWAAGPCMGFGINNVWFNTTSTTGKLMALKGCRENIISQCLFTGAGWDDSYTCTGIYAFGDDTDGIMNLGIDSCQFYSLGYGAYIDQSTVVSWGPTAGIRFDNVMMIGCATGLYARNVDTLNFGDSMIDNCHQCITLDGVNRATISESYLSPNENGKGVIDCFASMQDANYLDVHDCTLVSVAATKGNGIGLVANSGGYVQYGRIHNNVFMYLDKGIYAEGQGTKYAQNFNCHDNTFVNAIYGYYMTGNVALFNSHDERFESGVTPYHGFAGHKEDAYISGNWTESP